MEKLLEKLGIIHKNHVHEYYPSVRDNKNTKVYKCDYSGVIFLKQNNLDQKYYKDKKVCENLNCSFEKINGNDIACAVNNDDERRAAQFKSLIKGKTWLDFGCGSGRLIDLLKNVAMMAHGYELNNIYIESMKQRGIKVQKTFTEKNYNSYDVITLFHVLEHIPNPLEVLDLIFKLLKKGGTLIIEVPHANDFLLKSLDLECFKQFTLWSEHLVLHTRGSLEVFLKSFNPERFLIKGYQRYSLDNHLQWLRYGKPGGHDSYFRDIVTDDLKKAYENFLISIDQIDTLIAFVYK
jgi:2-polyprenyl-3-methyl-5-hydroxy-6-metoxy-1,4-benzoquinol methylase